MISTAVTAAAEKSQADAQSHAISAQEQAQQNQITQAAGQEDTVAAQQARQARSQSIVAAGAAGVNLKSNSFMASLQTTTMNQATEENLIGLNAKNSSNASLAEANSELASKATSPTFMGAALDTALAGAGAYVQGTEAQAIGAKTRSAGLGS
jgi:hypothetical protein